MVEPPLRNMNLNEDGEGGEFLGCLQNNDPQLKELWIGWGLMSLFLTMMIGREQGTAAAGMSICKS